jgi:hypothetical protein
MLVTMLAGSALVAEARTGSTAAFSLTNSPQIQEIIRAERRRQRRRDRDRDRNWDRNGNVRYETRIVHKGHKIYRDTYRITWKNGREKSKRVSHVRIG